MKTKLTDTDDRSWAQVWCPACERMHTIPLTGAVRWDWDGNEEAPTFSPSLLVQGTQWPADYPFHLRRHHVGPGSPTVCHSFLRAGVWEFQPDSTHDLAGQRVPMVDVPDSAEG